MAEIVTMPKLSDTMTEGVIAAWHKKIGDTVETGELMAEIESDKATMEYESYNDGVVLYIGGEVGASIPVNGVLAIVGEAGEDYSALLSGGEAPKEEATTTPEAAQPAAAPTEAIDVSGIDAEIVTMPKLSDTMTEGVIAAWHKKVGEKVSEGELLAEIESDKATMEYESYNEGTVLYIGADAGGAVPVNGILAIVGAEGADYETLLKAETAKSSTPAPAAVKEEAPKAPTESKPTPQTSNTPSKAAKPASETGERVKASPLAKALADSKGFNLANIPGSGPEGRVIKVDVESFTPQATANTTNTVFVAAGEESFDDQPMNGMRKAITRNLNASQFGAPHFYLTMDIDMDNAIAARKSMNEVAPAKISFNDMVVKAVAASLKQHPMVNSTVEGDTIRVANHINVGIAVAIPDGLVVPVVKHTDTLSLSQISAAVKDKAGKAKDKKLSTDEMTGATFTISNLGMFGIEQFTSIINAPASCILAVGGIKQVPVVKNGQLVAGNVMKVTLTCDHRSVDGAIGAAFLKTLKELIEDPVRILI